jgi:hypothetical protein
MARIDATAGLILAAAGLVAWVVWRGGRLTETATNAAGQPVTAYRDAGVIGTLGAAANAASGGTLASLGEWIGSAAYDLFNPGTDTTPAPAAPTLTTGDLSRADRLAEPWALPVGGYAGSGGAAFGIYPRP